MMSQSNSNANPEQKKEDRRSKQSAKPRFEVKKWNAVMLWSWDIAVESCAICRNHIMEKCIECHATHDQAEDECKIAWGVCNHAFHFHCISRWIRTRNVCPMCNAEWNYARYGSN